MLCSAMKLLASLATPFLSTALFGPTQRVSVSSVDSHSCANCTFNSFRFTFLRKNRGWGGLPGPFPIREDRSQGARVAAPRQGLGTARTHQPSVVSESLPSGTSSVVIALSSLRMASEGKPAARRLRYKLAILFSEISPRE